LSPPAALPCLSSLPFLPFLFLHASAAIGSTLLRPDSPRMPQA
jgi:hypothetical protein